jgi:hypothetical protein
MRPSRLALTEPVPDGLPAIRPKRQNGCESVNERRDRQQALRADRVSSLHIAWTAPLRVFSVDFKCGGLVNFNSKPVFVNDPLFLTDCGVNRCRSI